MVTINNGSIRACLCHILAFMWSCSGCFGCCINGTPVITVDEPSKGWTIQGQMVKKPSISDGFWSTSTCDLDSHAVQSQKSASSVSTSNPTLDQSSAAGNSSSQPDFVNQGLLCWNQTRLQWIRSGRSEIRTPQSWKLRSGWNATYESLLTNKKPFRHPIPLPEIVDFLVDVWEHEGLYD